MYEKCIISNLIQKLELFLRQFLRMFISLTSYRDPSSKSLVLAVDLAVDQRSTTKGRITTRSRSAICACQVFNIVRGKLEIWMDLPIKT